MFDKCVELFEFSDVFLDFFEKLRIVYIFTVWAYCNSLRVVALMALVCHLLLLNYTVLSHVRLRPIKTNSNFLFSFQISICTFIQLIKVLIVVIVILRNIAQVNILCSMRLLLVRIFLCFHNMMYHTNWIRRRLSSTEPLILLIPRLIIGVDICCYS